MSPRSEEMIDSAGAADFLAAVQAMLTTDGDR